ncbi:MAG: tyrosine-type recombinase/integrase, partial [Paramuribaculum sp.]|nr:tyrosine-type recombinase/integrase [Paramuribaculum sp.]
GTITANPVSGINPGRLPKRLPVNVKPEETASMLDGMAENDGDFTAVRNRLIMEMLYETGMRSAEIMGLRDDQVDTRRQELRVLGKRNKERIIPFGASLAGLIDEYREARLMPGGPGAADSGQPMFVRPDGRPLYRKLVYNIVHSAMSDAGVHATRLSPHVMRHSFATDMLSGGAALNSVQQLLGHASLATTQIYTHISLEELRKNYAAAHPRASHHNQKYNP